MKNDEIGRRMQAFFAAAPRPSAPDALRRLPATVVSAGPDRERVRVPASACGGGQVSDLRVS